MPETQNARARLSLIHLYHSCSAVALRRACYIGPVGEREPLGEATVVGQPVVARLVPD